MVAVFAAAAINGCTTEQPTDGTGGTADEVTFTVNIPGHTDVATRADGSPAENKIETLTILVCEPGESGKLLHKVAPKFTASNSYNKTWTITARIPYSNAARDLLFVANADCSSLTGGTDGTDTQATIRQTLKSTEDDGVVPSDDGKAAIPMFGELSGEIIKDNKYKPDLVSLQRVMARVKVEVASDVESKFTLQTVAFANAAEIVGSFPESKGPFYLYERSAGVVYPATGWEGSPHIIVGGKYEDDSDATYYRLDYIASDGPYKGKALGIVRNHSYNFTITDVTGPGYGSPEDASDNPPRNISADVLSWDDGAIAEADNAGSLNGPIYTVTPGTTTGGTVTVRYPKALPGMTITVATVPKDGYTLTGWKLSPTNIPEASLNHLIKESDPAANPITFTMPPYDVTVTPIFEQELPLGSTLNRGFILYFDGEGDNARLLLSEYDTGNPDANNNVQNDHAMVLNKDNILTKVAFFKFGSVIGIANKFEAGDSIPFTLDDIKFNPTPLIIGLNDEGGIGSFNGAMDSTAPREKEDFGIANSPPGIPGFVPEVYSSTITDITSSDYHNVTNLKIGRGDPCQLVGLTAKEIRDALANGTFDALANGRIPEYKGWVTPSFEQNTTFVVGDNDDKLNLSEAIVQDQGYHVWTSSDAQNPGIGEILRHHVYLPAAGQRLWPSVASQHNGTQGYYWSSSVWGMSNLTLGVSLQIGSNMKVKSGVSYAVGLTVRCVRP